MVVLNGIVPDGVSYPNRMHGSRYMTIASIFKFVTYSAIGCFLKPS